MHSLIVPDFNQIWIFLTDFRQILKYQTSCKCIQWELSFVMRTDGQTDKHRQDEANKSSFESLRKSPNTNIY
jgi:hypothetical protein